MVQAAKTKARGYRSTRNLKAIIYLLAGKLDMQLPALCGRFMAIRPVFHQEQRRIEAHIFIAFLAYCLQITLQRRLHALAPGRIARSTLEKFAAVQMIDVHLPTTDGRASCC